MCFKKLSLLIQFIKSGCLDNLKNGILVSLLQEHIMENPNCDPNACECKGYLPKLKSLILDNSDIYFERFSEIGKENNEKYGVNREKARLDGELKVKLFDKLIGKIHNKSTIRNRL